MIGAAWATLPNFVFAAACGVIAWGGFCRLTRLSLKARLVMRVACYAVTVAALWAGAAVLLWGHAVTWPVAALACSVAAMLGAGSRSWHAGVPAAHLLEKPG